jgi:hypothetical protein
MHVIRLIITNIFVIYSYLIMLLIVVNRLAFYKMDNIKQSDNDTRTRKQVLANLAHILAPSLARKYQPTDKQSSGNNTLHDFVSEQTDGEGKNK